MDVKIGPWAYVSFRGDGVDVFPHFSTITETLKDTSLSHHDLTIKAIVCSNAQEINARLFGGSRLRIINLLVCMTRYTD